MKFYVSQTDVFILYYLSNYFIWNLFNGLNSRFISNIARNLNRYRYYFTIFYYILNQLLNEWLDMEKLENGYGEIL